MIKPARGKQTIYIFETDQLGGDTRRRGNCDHRYDDEVEDIPRMSRKPMEGEK